MVEKIKFIDCEKLQDCRFAPYADEEAFIIDRQYVINNGECQEFDCEFYAEIFEVLETYD